MSYIIKLLIVGAIVLVGYYFPKSYNEYFRNKYHEAVVCTPLAVSTAIAAVLWLLFMDQEGFWYWAFLIAAISLCAVSVIYAISIGCRAEAGVFEIIVAVLAQIFATAGVTVLILVIIGFIMELFGGKKKRRR